MARDSISVDYWLMLLRTVDERSDGVVEKKTKVRMGSRVFN
jgi:hypothetical protein